MFNATNNFGANQFTQSSIKSVSSYTQKSTATQNPHQSGNFRRKLKEALKLLSRVLDTVGNPLSTADSFLYKTVIRFIQDHTALLVRDSTATTADFIDEEQMQPFQDMSKTDEDDGEPIESGDEAESYQRDTTKDSEPSSTNV